ncbi:MAG: carbamoyltransferase HypF [Candidatus Hydrogenedentes bacterium]|nr:carbamoyltransferase HypF [Candidatus Hydrogenedentota bacterium]
MDNICWEKSDNPRTVRCIITVEGAVQGIGFRPFIYRLAKEYRLTGLVRNTVYGVQIEVQGPFQTLQGFINDLESKKPVHAVIERVRIHEAPPISENNFVIIQSDTEGILKTRVMPDISTCSECLREMNNPSDRRYRYPFINCTLCGPRYTIIIRMPYDRVNTSMAEFKMCDECREEYENPNTRRFHAEPIACPNCGPQVALWDREGKVIYERDDAINEAVRLIKDGKILAIKGIGGFHLVVDARNSESVKLLRMRKLREEKPFALMYPDLNTVKIDCEVSEVEEKLLVSAEAPIVLLKRRNDSTEVSKYVAPEQDRFGVMLPYAPLHHLLLSALGFPVVATSGNRSEEPICTDELEALGDLRDIADYFLVHNRKILRAVDDSIVQVVDGCPIVLRRARGYVPQPVVVPQETSQTILAVGGHLKNTVAISFDNQVVISQHLGDLETKKAQDNFCHSVTLLSQLVERKPEVVACDAHPDYASTQWAEKQGLKVVKVQHHIAHAFSVMAEKKVDTPAFAVIWDGTGFGLDGTIWGGEFLVISREKIQRWGHFRTFPLPGGDKAVREPRRTALGMIYELLGNKSMEYIEKEIGHLREVFSDSEWNSISVMLKKGINSPRTSSVGRIFDGVASILNLYHTCSYEAQSAMRLESIARCYKTGRDDVYKTSESFLLKNEHGVNIIDWGEFIKNLINKFRGEKNLSELANLFHWTLANTIKMCVETAGIKNVILNGGCFQNSLLLEYTVNLLKDNYNVYFAQNVPPNDGGISLGQIYYAVRVGKE